MGRAMWEATAVADTPKVGVRVDPEMLTAARRAAPELATVNVAHLLRVGLAVLAGYPVDEAVSKMQRKTGPKRHRAGAGV